MAKAIDNTDAEKSNLEVSLKKLLDRAKNIKTKMDIADGRVKVRLAVRWTKSEKCDLLQHRYERPTREMVNDTVQLQLRKQGLLLQSYLSGVESRAKAASNNIQRLERIRHILQKDLDAKVGVKRLTLACGDCNRPKPSI